MEDHKPEINEHLLQAVHRLNRLVLLVVLSIAGMLIVFIQMDNILSLLRPEEEVTTSRVTEAAKTTTDESDQFWQAPPITSLTDPALKAQVEYGRELIAHTARYLGPNGSVAHITNGMNCQNCHLDAGTRVFGNNYGSVASTYPKFRARSGSEEDIVKRVNDCLERSLNGKPLAEESREMQAIKAYIEFLGANVPKVTKAEG